LLKDCAEFGVTVALDDFGTGYSSLSYLKNLPVNTLKIDQSFIRGISDSDDDKVILTAILGLAQAFKLHVIAEGVETIDHGKLLIEAGCHFAQGYVIARPMPAAEISDWLKSWQIPDEWHRAALSSEPQLRRIPAC
jgi:EAL domain-containing protein (putative c-di-GMP-specific phosphodiesterase class I)